MEVKKRQTNEESSFVVLGKGLGEKYKYFNEGYNKLVVAKQKKTKKLQKSLQATKDQTLNKIKSGITKYKSLILSEKKLEDIEDSLNRKVYARRIASLIQEKHETKGVAFAISGEWGSGKTKVLKLIQEFLTSKNFKIVWFDVWQYSQEPISLKRAFLSNLDRELGGKTNLSDLYSDSSTVKISWEKLLPLFFRLFLFVFVLAYFSYINFASENNIYNANAFISYEIQFFKSVAGWISANIGIGIFGSILIFLLGDIFSIKQKVSKIATSEKFKEKFEEIIKGEKRVVIFVDDLDRCTPEIVKEVLDALTTFFKPSKTSKTKCSFVVTGDHTVIEKYVGNLLQVEPSIGKNGEEDIKKTKMKEKSEGRRFLKKMFDIYWQIPLPEPALFKIFSKKEIKKSGIANLSKQSKDDLVAILDKFLNRNPRAVVRFLSSVKFNLDTISLMIREKKKVLKKKLISKTNLALVKTELENLKDVEANPVLLAKILLIQDLFYPLYEALIKAPEVVILHEKQAREGEITALADSAADVTLLIEEKEVYLYSELMKLDPRFTDLNGDVIYSPGNFLYRSGFTGLPSQRGPDEDRFLNLFKKSGASEEIIKSLEITPEARHGAYRKLIEELFSGTKEPPEASTIAINILSTMEAIESWRSDIEKVVDKFKELSLIDQVVPERKNEIVKKIIKICIQSDKCINEIFDTELFNRPEFLLLKMEVLEELPNVQSIDAINKFAGLISEKLDTEENLGIGYADSLFDKVDFTDKKVKSLFDPLQQKIAKSILSTGENELRQKRLQTLLKIDPDSKQGETVFSNLKNTVTDGDFLPEAKFVFENQETISKYIGQNNYRDLKAAIIKKLSSLEEADWKSVVIEFMQYANWSSSEKDLIVDTIVSFLKSDKEEIVQEVIKFIKNGQFKKFTQEQDVFDKLVKVLINTQDDDSITKLLVGALNKNNWGSDVKIDIEALGALRKIYYIHRIKNKKLSKESTRTIKSWGAKVIVRNR